MKKITLFTLVAIFTMALIGCETTKETNSNTAVVVNDNSNVNRNANVNSNANTNRSNRETTREDVDKDRATYEKQAEEAGSKVGQGANDMWLWTKVRAALLATDDLRESTINVDVENDIVTLRGTVGTAAQKASAVKVAKGIEGVKDVKDTLKVAANDSITNTSTTNSNSAANKSNTNK